MFRSLPSRIQLSEREIHQTLQKVIVECAVRQRVTSQHMNDVPIDPFYYGQGSPWYSSLQSASSEYVCTPSDATGEVSLFGTDANDRGCLPPALAGNPRSEMLPSGSSAVGHSDDDQSFYHHHSPRATVRLVRTKPNVDSGNQCNSRLDRDEDGPRTTGVSNEADDDDGSPPEQEPQRLPMSLYRVRRVVGSGHHGTFL